MAAGESLLVVQLRCVPGGGGGVVVDWFGAGGED
jgi:hypothetical protein